MISGMLVQEEKKLIFEGIKMNQRVGNEIQLDHKSIGTGRSIVKIHQVGLPSFMFPECPELPMS